MKDQWYLEVHEPNTGHGSCKHHASFNTLADMQAEMKEHPGMIFRVTVPEGASASEREEFARMNIQRL